MSDLLRGSPAGRAERAAVLRTVSRRTVHCPESKPLPRPPHFWRSVLIVLAVLLWIVPKCYSLGADEGATQNTSTQGR